jgi:hypothetical protein
MMAVDTIVLPPNSFGSTGDPIGTEFNSASTLVAMNGFWFNPAEYDSGSLVEVDYYLAPDSEGDFPSGYGEYDVAIFGTVSGTLESSFQDSSGYWTPPGNPVRFRFEMGDFGESPSAEYLLLMHQCVTPANFYGTGLVTITISS